MVNIEMPMEYITQGIFLFCDHSEHIEDKFHVFI